ncbi:MAG: beta-N-acetylglucosaminidase domain-containing protein [Acidobacteriota bacterium]|nr:MAG: beta-N-acetylglucosaminidase domain-containing protein [Acidobacteriota bacterium]
MPADWMLQPPVNRTTERFRDWIIWSAGALCLLYANACGTADQGESGFADFGVIESFHAPAWSHQDRLDILSFMGELGMTSYFYAPRDDPFQRERWRHPYTGRALQEFQEVLAAAQANRVRFHAVLRPGNSISYSSQDDQRMLLNKLDSLRDLGVEHFALFFDDVPLRLKQPQDQSAFTSLAEAQAQAINQVYEFLQERSCTLSICPTVYSGEAGDADYLRELGRKVHGDVAFLWSGSDSTPPDLTVDAARRWQGVIGRRPVIWDRYPANDFTDWRLFLGPVSGLDHDLSNVSDQILSNPMKQAHASMIALATFADYARDPIAYEPEEARRRAVQRLYGRNTARLIRPFLEIYGGSPGTEHLFDPLFIPRDSFSVPEIDDGLGRLEAALRNLKSDDYRADIDLIKLLRELEPTVVRARERYDELLADDRFERRGEELIYRREIDRYQPRLVSRELDLDGDIRDWQGTDWITLSSGGGESFDYGVEVALCQTASNLYVGLDILDRTPVRYSGEKIGEGDHVALLIADPNHPGAFQVHLIPPDSSQVPVASWSSPRHNPASRGLQATSELIFDTFFVSLLQELPQPIDIEVTSRRTGSGYIVEVRLPKGSFTESNLNLVVVDSYRQGRRFFSLSKRNYPANTKTYASISYN